MRLKRFVVPKEHGGSHLITAYFLKMQVHYVGRLANILPTLNLQVIGLTRQQHLQQKKNAALGYPTIYQESLTKVTKYVHFILHQRKIM